MTSAIAQWGNSAAVRIPKAVLKHAGLELGDKITISVNGRGYIELAPSGTAHRHARPTEGVTVESLFAGYDEERHDSGNAWPSDELIGAEREAWT